MTIAVRSTQTASRRRTEKWRSSPDARYGQIDKLTKTFGEDVNYICSVDPVAAQLLDPSALDDGLGEITEEMVAR